MIVKIRQKQLWNRSVAADRPLGLDERPAEVRRAQRAQFLARCLADIQKGMDARRRAIDAMFRAEARNIATHLKATWRMSREDTEEIIQEVFVRLCKSTPTAREIEFPLAYLMATIRNCVIDEWRRRPPTMTAGGIGGEDEPVTAVLERLIGASDDEIELLGLRDCVRKALDDLLESNPDARLVIDLAVIYEFSGEEVALAIGRTHGAARQFLYESKRKLGQMLVSRCPDYVPKVLEGRT